ncbi:MAG TPA: hypothetical protein VN833_28450 [Candidatus Acidoferrales bacterium]|nr:hypothetical protein [Candidatus Acidoferrales bacterium]
MAPASMSPTAEAASERIALDMPSANDFANQFAARSEHAGSPPATEPIAAMARLRIAGGSASSSEWPVAALGEPIGGNTTKQRTSGASSSAFLSAERRQL